MLVTYRVELMQMNDGIGTIRLQDSHLETFGISRQKIREAAFANLEGIVDFMTLRDDASGFKMVAATRRGGVDVAPVGSQETCRDVRDR